MQNAIGYFACFPELGEAWFRTSQLMMLISGPNGEVYDANDAFLSFIHYSLYEFRRETDPITWKDITPDDSDRSADEAQAARCANGEIQGYAMRESYVPKGATSRIVDIFVRRFPREGGREEFKFFIVEVHPIEEALQRVCNEMFQLQGDTLEVLEDLTKQLLEMRKTFDLQSREMKLVYDISMENSRSAWMAATIKIGDWGSKNPRTFNFLIVVAVLTAVLLMVGTEAFREIMSAFRDLLGGTPLIDEGGGG